mgnify:CR=1 FL=1|jgi:5-methylcytosine-specific restriction endonuclease McrA
MKLWWSRKEQTYQEFLKSDKWKRFRQKVKKRDGFMCRVCGSTYKLIVHHVGYEQGWTNMHNCTTLCTSCHKIFHISKGEKVEL